MNTKMLLRIVAVISSTVLACGYIWSRTRTANAEIDLTLKQVISKAEVAAPITAVNPPEGTPAVSPPTIAIAAAPVSQSSQSPPPSVVVADEELKTIYIPRHFLPSSKSAPIEIIPASPQPEQPSTHPLIDRFFPKRKY